MRRAVIAATAFTVACSAPPSPSVSADVSCVPETHALRQLCTVALTDRATGQPIEGVTVMLSADMPSMPLAHSVRPVSAEAVGPGMYSGTLDLEMRGRWVIAVRISGPANDQLTHTLNIN